MESESLEPLQGPGPCEHLSESLHPLQGTASCLHLPTCKKKKRTVLLEKCVHLCERQSSSLSCWRALVAECLATFLYLFLALLPSTSTEVRDQNTYTWGHSEVLRHSLAFGLCRGALVRCFGPLSGCQMNPAITGALVISRKMSLVEGALFTLAQCTGSIAGSALLFGIAPSQTHAQLGIVSLHPGLGTAQGLAVEILMTFLLVFTYCASLDSDLKITRGDDAWAVGGVVLVLHAIGIPVTGCAVNPARALGPAFIRNTWKHHWVYWLGPYLGGVLAALLYFYVFYPSTKTSTHDGGDDDIPKEPPPKLHPMTGLLIPVRSDLPTNQCSRTKNAYEITKLHPSPPGSYQPPAQGPYKLVRVLEDDTDEDGYTKAVL